MDEKALEYHRQWRAKNRDKILTQRKARRKAKAESEGRPYREREQRTGRTTAEYQRDWVAANRDHIREYARNRYRALSTAQRFVRNSNARAQKLGVPGVLSAEHLPVGPCVYCGRQEEPIGWDHVAAMGRGGANELWNIVRCCKPCNTKKQAMTPDEWRGTAYKAAQRDRKRAYVRQWHRDHYAELYAKRRARRDKVGHW